MGFYVANEQQAVAGKPRSGSSRCAHGQKTPLKKSRLGFFSSTRSRAEFSVSQPVEPHRENEPTPTIIVSGVRYYGYRYYSPSLGRWLSNDPLMDPGSVPALMIKDKLIKMANGLIIAINRELQDSDLTLEQQQTLRLGLILCSRIRDLAVNGDPKLFMLFTGNNFYQFCANNTVSFADPLGLSFIEFINWVASWFGGVSDLPVSLEGIIYNELTNTVAIVTETRELQKTARDEINDYFELQKKLDDERRKREECK